MKKILIKIGFIVLGILLILGLNQMHNFLIINKVHHALETFQNEENRYCSVLVMKENTNRKEELFIKNEIVKYCEEKESFNYLQWRNYSTKQQYDIDVQNKTYNKIDLLGDVPVYLLKTPSAIVKIYQNGKFNLSGLFDVRYVIPVKYNEKSCYKIVTKNEVIIIDKNTYLPIYSSIKFMDKNETKNQIEYNYAYEVGKVKDEDVELPDLTGYTMLEEN